MSNVSMNSFITRSLGNKGRELIPFLRMERMNLLMRFTHAVALDDGLYEPYTVLSRAAEYS